MNNANRPTKEALMLHTELKRRSIVSVLEHHDNHKHVDLFVPAANLYIEIDGPKHYTDATQIMADLMRDHYSDLEGYPTLRIPNNMISEYKDKVADAIQEIAETHK